jgi:GNAT superfamily N-acetyltransferase
MTGMTKIDLRPAAEEDLKVVLALLSQSTTSSMDLAPAVFRRMQQYPNYKVYLAVVGDEPVGTFALMIMDNLGHMCAPIAIVENVVVHADWRRRGIGRSMMSTAVDLGRQSGAYKLILASNTRLNEAHMFYESLGFSRQGYAYSMAL